MEEVILKTILSTGGFAGALFVFHLYKIEPRLRSMENTILRQGKIDLLRLAASPHVAPELKEAGKTILDEIEQQLRP